MKCPNCDVTLAMSERSGVEIDYCPQCRGVWLDRGEIDRLLEMERAQVAAVPVGAPASPPPPPMHRGDGRRDDDRYDDDERGGRRKRGWADLLDFG